jgi:hypothetical protein
MTGLSRAPFAGVLSTAACDSATCLMRTAAAKRAVLYGFVSTTRADESHRNLIEPVVLIQLRHAVNGVRRKQRDESGARGHRVAAREVAPSDRELCSVARGAGG